MNWTAYSLLGNRKMKKNSLNDRAAAYAVATGKCPAYRSVKAQVYGVGKPVATGAERTASAAALPERIGAQVDNPEIVPKNANVCSASSPINNMGENLIQGGGAPEQEHWFSISEDELGHVDLVMTDSGKVKTVMVRVPAASQACIVDWINFTVLEDTFFKTARQTLVADEQIIEEASRQFAKVFGFGITAKRDRGMNFYRDSWVLGDGMGFVCFGGQRATMLVTLTGHGCQNALPGWEGRLYEFLTKVAVRPSISRIDLAHDDLDGNYLSVDWAEAQWDSGGFSFREGGRPPECQQLGNWKRPNGKGRTFTIGRRNSSKFCRFYEKGKKEGDKQSLWCRCEIEFHNTNTVIAFEVLLNPTSYFVGAYPCIASFATVETPQRMVVKQKTANIVIDAAAEWMRKQVGKYLRVFRELHGDAAALDLLCNADEDYWPKRLRPLTSDHRSPVPALHEDPAVRIPTFFDFIKTVPSYGLNGGYGHA